MQKSIKCGGSGGGNSNSGAMNDSGVTIKLIKATQQSINYSGGHKDYESNHNDVTNDSGATIKLIKTTQ